MAKKSGGDKFPFFQEARLELQFALGFEAFDSLNCWKSKFVIEVEQKERIVISTKNNLCNNI